MKNPLNGKEKTTYSCSGFSVVGDCKLNIDKVCTKDLGTCLKKGSGSLSRPSDGIRDDTKMKTYSEVNTVCCTSDKLSHLLSREWQENKQETWDVGKFGSKCKSKY